MTKETPRSILLATDLSARCDRALDRANRLAAAWGADLFALTVVEPAESDPAFAALLPSWRQPADPVERAARRLRADLPADAADVTPLVGEGDPAEVIARVAEERGCGLIVTGLARDETLGRFSLGSTVDRLIRRSAAPVLIVRNRVSRDYRRLVAATDFSPSSRHALETAARWFPGRHLTLLHAYDVPFSGMVSDGAAYRRAYRDQTMAQCREFLAATDLPAEVRAAVTPVVENGAPEQLVHDYVQEFEADLVVLGSRGRSAALDLLVGNTASGILARLACDALVVRKPDAAAPPA